MVKNFRRILIGLVLASGVWGCAARDDVIVLDNRLYTLQRQIQQVRDDTEGMKKQLTSRTEQLEKKIDSAQQPLLENQASSLNELEGIKGRLQTLQGRMESLEFSQKKDTAPRAALETLSKELKELQARVQRLEQPGAPPAKAEKTAEPAKESKEDRTEEKGAEKAKPPSGEELFQQGRTAQKRRIMKRLKKNITSI
jgi:TolA-binding protein